jgi:hypothetical protein
MLVASILSIQAATFTAFDSHYNGYQAISIETEIVKGDVRTFNLKLKEISANRGKVAPTPVGSSMKALLIGG